MARCNYNAIHKADGSLATGQRLPFTTYETFFSGMVEQWNCTSQIIEQLGTVRPVALWIALFMVCSHCQTLTDTETDKKWVV